MRGRPKAELVLTEPEREELVALTLRRKTAQALALRARIVLACAEGQDSKVVAARQRVTPQTVSKWRGRYVRDRLDGLLDAPRSGAPRTIDDARVDAVIAKTLESVPEGATHWSTRTMAREAGLTQTAVSRASGAPSACSRIARRPSSSPPTRCSSTRCATSSGCTWLRR
jgi:transposase